MLENVILVGLMGAGKTTVGRAVARRLGRQFYDSDHEIEARTGVRIPVIFEHEGEDGFRQREAHTIDELTQRSGIVLATGGGAVLRAENRERIKSRGTVVYLRATPHDLWLRTRRDKNRPLLQTADPRARLEQLFQERDALYRECATFVIETGRPSVNALVNMVLMQLEVAGIVPSGPPHEPTNDEDAHAHDGGAGEGGAVGTGGEDGDASGHPEGDAEHGPMGAMQANGPIESIESNESLPSDAADPAMSPTRDAVTR